MTFTCTPDRYMSETRIKALVADVNESVADGQSVTAVSSSLINEVRLVYMSALLDTREELHSQQRKHELELAALRQQLEVAQQLTAKDTSHTAETEESSDSTEAAKPTLPEIPQLPELTPQQEDQPTEIWWPANTFTLYVGTSYMDYRRDLVSWQRSNSEEWTDRLYFSVFKFDEPGLIKICVVESVKPPKRVMVTQESSVPEGWEHRMDFYAYGRPRPGARLIWVAYRGDPDRCIFLKGLRTDVLEGWERRLDFWVPG